MGWLGIDDTDHLGGGCTTKSAHDLIQRLPPYVRVQGLRLVRLWPFAPGRTRGNAAVAMELHCDDVSALLTHLNREWEEHLQPLKGALSSSHHSDRHQHPADPGMVWFDSPPSPSFYLDAVRSLVDLGSVPTATRAWGGEGRIGATAAVAWPSKNATYEAIAWRSNGSTGPRMVDASALNCVDQMKGTFLSRDPRNGSSLVAPRGPSPVLFGVRATTSEVAGHAATVIAEGLYTEPLEDWRCFETNQASGDHLDGSVVAQVMSVEVHPKRKHARLMTDAGPMVAYAESGDVNRLARWLKAGDAIESRGLTDRTGTLHIEQLRLQSARPRGKSRPPCPQCGRRMKSMGQQQGLRCPACKHRSPKGWVDVASVPPFTGWVEPPANARRHLAKPLEWSNMTQ